MTHLYQKFIGIDIGKSEFVANIHGNKTTKTYANNHQGITLFYQEHHDILPNALVVVEVTGGYERDIIHALHARQLAVHRASGRQVKNFIRSYGIIAKNDHIDAKALSLYACERADKLVLYQDNPHEHLRFLQSRRMDMVKMRASEKNRAQAPSGIKNHPSFKAIMDTLNEHIDLIDQEMTDLIHQNPELKEKVAILQTVPGIGQVIATQLITLMPEMGRMNQMQVASLAGLAPHPNQSGQKEGYRKTRGGRRQIPVVLHMAAMSAARGKNKIADFYQHLIARDKAPLVALTAVARKIIVIANARLKSPPQST